LISFAVAETAALPGINTRRGIRPNAAKSPKIANSILK
jgi:hypothetical protein